jgi:hypothetical protein
VVKSRSGSVLTRGFILKTDFYPNGTSFYTHIMHVDSLPYSLELGRALDLDINLGGAPNFRSPQAISFNVFGVAQPRIAGITAILSLLQCRPRPKTRTASESDDNTLNWEPKAHNAFKCLWFNTREEPVGTSFHDIHIYLLMSYLLCILNIVYIGTRPFVLRDAADPTRNLRIADSAEILEAVELRLKNDILREAAKYVPPIIT